MFHISFQFIFLLFQPDLRPHYKLHSCRVAEHSKLRTIKTYQKPTSMLVCFLILLKNVIFILALATLVEQFCEALMVELFPQLTARCLPGNSFCWSPSLSSRLLFLTTTYITNECKILFTGRNVFCFIACTVFKLVFVV